MLKNLGLIYQTEDLLMISDSNTPAQFLIDLGERLKTIDGQDVDLAKIIDKHLLTTDPTKDCVDQAMIAISELAASRASAPKDDADG